MSFLKIFVKFPVSLYLTGWYWKYHPKTSELDKITWYFKHFPHRKSLMKNFKVHNYVTWRPEGRSRLTWTNISFEYFMKSKSPILSIQKETYLQTLHFSLFIGWNVNSWLLVLVFITAVVVMIEWKLGQRKIIISSIQRLWDLFDVLFNYLTQTILF